MCSSLTAAFDYSAPNTGAEYCDERVSVCLSVRSRIFRTARPIFTIFLRVLPMTYTVSSGALNSTPTNQPTYGRGSVLLWRRSDTLCTSGLCMTS